MVRGRLLLRRSNTYAKGTYLNAGTLVIGNASGAVGTGTAPAQRRHLDKQPVERHHSIDNRRLWPAHHCPRRRRRCGSVGTITTSSSVTLNSNSTVDFYHGGGSGSGSWDMLMDSGALTFSGLGQTTINVSNFPIMGGSYTDDLIDFTAGLAGDVVNANDFNLVGATSELPVRDRRGKWVGPMHSHWWSTAAAAPK